MMWPVARVCGVCVFVCVCARERDRESMCVFVCVCTRAYERMCARMCVAVVHVRTKGELISVDHAQSCCECRAVANIHLRAVAHMHMR